MQEITLPGNTQENLSDVKIERVPTIVMPISYLDKDVLIVLGDLQKIEPVKDTLEQELGLITYSSTPGLFDLFGNQTHYNPAVKVHCHFDSFEKGRFPLFKNPDILLEVLAEHKKTIISDAAQINIAFNLDEMGTFTFKLAELAFRMGQYLTKHPEELSKLRVVKEPEYVF